MILATTTRKGGAAKTSMAVNLAAVLGVDRRVLIVDLDEQGDASEWMGVGGTGRELAAALLGRGGIDDSIRTSGCGVDVAVGGEALSHLNGDLDPMALRRALADLGPAYDVVIVDCPPNLEASVRAGWLAGNDVVALVPVTGPQALRATRRTLNAWRDVGLDPAAIRIVLNRQDPRRILDRALVRQAGELGVRVLDTCIRESVVVRESAAWREPVPIHAPHHRVVEDYRDLAEEVMRG